MPEEFKLDARGKFVGIEILVNDLPLATLRDGGNVAGARINHEVVPGLNSVTLRVTLAASRPAVSPDSLTLLRVTKEGDVLYEHTWNADRNAPVLPAETTGSFDAGEGTGRWPWFTAPLLAEPLPDAEGLNELYVQLHQALNDRDIDGVAALLAHKSRDLAQAFGLDDAQEETNQREFFTDLFAVGDWAMEPLNLNGAQQVLCGNGRIVHTLTPDNREPIRSVPDADGVIFSLPVLASHFDDGWVIVR